MRLAYKRRQRFVLALDNDRAGERGWRKTWDETDRSLPTLCGQTRVGWIHEHGSSETIGGSFLEPNARRRGFLKLVKGEGLHICQILETQAHSDFVSGAVKEFFSFS
jgi:hypothetical protein